ncbi:MAG: hypothetical protein U0984_12595 [Prosthecobacter sp.]|nr:hypothetical protein [Prosthecobacter sp.]
MNLTDYLGKAREMHLAALAGVLRERRQTDPQAVSEVLIELNSEAFSGIYRLRRPDILHRDDHGQIRITEVNEDRYLSFDPFVTAPMPGISIRYTPFHWYSLEVRVVGEITDWTPFEKWAHYWMDAEDARLVEGQEWSNTIHDVTEPSLGEGVWTFAIDLGSADVECIPQLVNLLVELGARTIELGTMG